MSFDSGGVGSFRNMNKRTIRMDVNPADKCTIVSVMPRKISDTKHTIQPGFFEIAGAEDGDFSILVIGSSSWWRETGENEPLLEIPVSSFTVATSFINDYCSGLAGCNMGDKMPGMFFVPGEYTKVTIQKYVDKNGKTFNQLLNEARTKQKNWFMELVRQADIMWARTSGNPLSISNDARLAAGKLQLDKPWMQDYKAVQMSNCPACGNIVNPQFPVCPNCKFVMDKEKAKAMTFATV